MRRFDYDFIKNGSIPNRLINYIVEIASLKTAAGIRKDEHKELYIELEKVAKVQSVKSSNEIEGIVSSDERINEIVNRSSAPKNHNEAEIAGYRDALNYIHQNYKDLDIDESLILYLHTLLMQHTTTKGGKYKDVNNLIIEVDKDGYRKVRFKPIPASETAIAMEQLILAYKDICFDDVINQLLLIPCFILDFLCIHPFADGNGRMSRLLTILLLEKAGFDVVKYVSFEEQINISKHTYYDALKQSSTNWDINENDYAPFIENCILTLYRCYHELDTRFNVVNSRKVSKKERVKQTVLNSIIPISKKEICSILLDVSPTTVEQVLCQLKKDGQIKLLNFGKSSRYIKI